MGNDLTIAGGEVKRIIFNDDHSMDIHDECVDDAKRENAHNHDGIDSIQTITDSECDECEQCGGKWDK